MKTLSLLIFACIVLIASSAQAQILPGGGDGDCATCVNVDSLTQECAPTNESGFGSSCTIHYSGGHQWCQWEGTCEPSFSSLDIRLAGTFASKDKEVRDDGTIRSRCSGFIVAWQRVATGVRKDTPAAALTMRI